MRLFSKVKPGTAFAAEAQNSGHQIPKPAALNTDTEDNALELQASGLFTCLFCRSYRKAALKYNKPRRCKFAVDNCFYRAVSSNGKPCCSSMHKLAR